MAEQYKLTYFNVMGLAEPIRFIFAHAGVEYEDERIEYPTWSEIEHTLPWGQLPILTVANGKKLAQSTGICRFLAKKFDLYPEDDFEAAKCDEYVEALTELRQEWNKFYFEKDAELKEDLKKDLKENAIPNFFSRFDKAIEENENEWMVGKKVTWADLVFAHFLEFFEKTLESDILDSYKNLKALKDSVHAIPQIKEYLANRTVTEL